jgi:hypothetical protein
MLFRKEGLYIRCSQSLSDIRFLCSSYIVYAVELPLLVTPRQVSVWGLTFNANMFSAHVLSWVLL